MVSKVAQAARPDTYTHSNKEQSQGGEMMQTAHEIGVSYTSDEVRAEQLPVRTKFNISMEKKIERLWHESDQQGWSYCQFVSVVMEVLTVLHHRNRLVRGQPANKKLPHKRRSLS